MSHANRGKAWEAMLDIYHIRYEKQGRAVVIRTPPPMRILRSAGKGTFVACYEKEGPPDYVLLTKGRPVMAEAKQCKGDRWPLKNLHAHQASRLDDWERQGGTGVVLLHHGPSRTAWVLPWRSFGPVWRKWYTIVSANRRAPSGSASLTLGDLQRLGRPFGPDGYLKALG